MIRSDLSHRLGVDDARAASGQCQEDGSHLRVSVPHEALRLLSRGRSGLESCEALVNIRRLTDGLPLDLHPSVCIEAFSNSTHAPAKLGAMVLPAQQALQDQGSRQAGDLERKARRRGIREVDDTTRRKSGPRRSDLHSRSEPARHSTIGQHSQGECRRNQQQPRPSETPSVAPTQTHPGGKRSHPAGILPRTGRCAH